MVMAVEEETWPRQTAEVDRLGVTFDLGGDQQNQLATLAGDQVAIHGREKGPPVQLTEFMDGAKVPPGCDKVISWVCCVRRHLLTFDEDDICNLSELRSRLFLWLMVRQIYGSDNVFF